MTVYADTAQMYEVLGQLWQHLLDHPEYGPKFREAGLTVKFNLSDPGGVIWITPQGVQCGAADGRADVEMSLKSETAHRFWLREVTLPVALARRELTAKGALNKVMQLLPLLKPLYEEYPALCRRYGLGD